jgi:hypothetical protein
MWTTLDGRTITLRKPDLVRMLPRLKRSYRLWRLVGRHFTGSLWRTLERLLGGLVSRATFRRKQVGKSGRRYLVFESDLDGVTYRIWTEPGGALKLVRPVAGSAEYDYPSTEATGRLQRLVRLMLENRGYHIDSDQSMPHSSLKPDIYGRRGGQRVYVEIDSSPSRSDQHYANKRNFPFPGLFITYSLDHKTGALQTQVRHTTGNGTPALGAVASLLNNRRWTDAQMTRRINAEERRARKLRAARSRKRSPTKRAATGRARAQRRPSRRGRQREMELAS